MPDTPVQSQQVGSVGTSTTQLSPNNPVVPNSENNSEQQLPAETVTTPVETSLDSQTLPPPYSQTDANVPVDAPPAYTDSVTSSDELPHAVLPTYEQVQLEKLMLGETGLPQPTVLPLPPPPHPAISLTRAQPYWLGVPANASNENFPSSHFRRGPELGTDCTFIFTFLLGFIFQWLALIVVMCMSYTVAARYGVLSGACLALAKYMLDARRLLAKDFSLVTVEDNWVWWFFAFLGLIGFIHTLVRFTWFKRNWMSMTLEQRERAVAFM